MNSREKFLAVMNFETDKPVLKAEFAYWAGTIRNWLEQGLPKIKEVPGDMAESEPLSGASPLSEEYSKKSEINVMKHLKLDSFLEKFPFDLSPQHKIETVSETSEYKIYKDSFGITVKALKDKSGTPMALDYPIKNKKDFYNYVLGYDEDFSKRLPKDFDALAVKLKNREFPVRLGGNPFGFSFLARHLMGEVNYMLNMYDDPGLLKEFNEFYLDFTMKYWSGILSKIDIDCVFIIEDIAYRSGSFISRDMFREFLIPYYVRFIDFLKQFKIKNIIVDCDGLIDELIPLWVKAGVTGIFPIEAVNDIEKIRESYPRLALLGGFNKKALFKDSGFKQIDIELEKTGRLLRKGGYIPHIDHAVSEDVTWENFRYYRTRLNDICDNIGG
ncbi:MAG TPA: uroporphyrinogen decarboxylase family protein [Candidatus Humimicrobiaceae bacterium]